MRQCMDAKNLHQRLNRIQGQIKAIDKMVDQDVPCEDILIQVNAAKISPAQSGSDHSGGTSESLRERWD